MPAPLPFLPEAPPLPAPAGLCTDGPLLNLLAGSWVPRLSVANVRIFPGVPAAPCRALHVMVARVRSGCPKLAFCSPVHSLRPPRPHLQGRGTQAALGRPGVSHAGWLSSQHTGQLSRGTRPRSCVRGLVPNDGLRSGGQAGSRLHPVPQDPALAVQLWHLLCRAPGPGISHVWLVSCQETRWSALRAAFLHPHPICPPTCQLAIHPPAHPLPPTLLLARPSTYPLTLLPTHLSTRGATLQLTIHPPVHTALHPVPCPHHPPITHQSTNTSLSWSCLCQYLLSSTYQPTHLPATPLTHSFYPQPTHSSKTHSYTSTSPRTYHCATHSSTLPINTPTSPVLHTHHL